MSNSAPMSGTIAPMSGTIAMKKLLKRFSSYDDSLSLSKAIIMHYLKNKQGVNFETLIRSVNDEISTAEKELSEAEYFEELGFQVKEGEDKYSLLGEYFENWNPYGNHIEKVFEIIDEVYDGDEDLEESGSIHYIFRSYLTKKYLANQD